MRRRFFEGGGKGGGKGEGKGNEKKKLREREDVRKNEGGKIKMGEES